MLNNNELQMKESHINLLGFGLLSDELSDEGLREVSFTPHVLTKARQPFTFTLYADGTALAQTIDKLDVEGGKGYHHEELDLLFQAIK